MLLLETLTFGIALWLGTYLISRNMRDLRLGLAGIGLVAYAIGLSLDILAHNVTDAVLTEQLLRWQRPLLFVPILCWGALLVVLLRGDESWYSRLQQHKRPAIVVLVVTIFFVLGLSFLLFPIEWLPRQLLLIGIGGDLLVLGFAVAVLDASDEGESLLPHAVRSFSYAFIFALIFGGQVGLVMGAGTGPTTPMLLLLLTTVAAAILVQNFAGPLQRGLDNVAFANQPEVRHTQAELRETAVAVPRLNENLDLTNLNDKEFTRLTRRALSHMDNLPRLSASPLTKLPLVEVRLQQRGAIDNTLQRAAELKIVLTESIEHLKPATAVSSGITNEWRYYNALYYPYVSGLKPYSRRMSHELLSEDDKQIMEWFRAQVPQRTLYNWQNAAAKLVAQDLRESFRAANYQKSWQP